MDTKGRRLTRSRSRVSKTPAPPQPHDRWAAAVRHLRKADPHLRAIIDRIGPCRLEPREDRFGTLVSSIISQQISSKAAASIGRRLVAIGGEPHHPGRLIALGEATLRSVGLSGAKARYVLNLAEAVHSGAVPLEVIDDSWEDTRIIQTLTTIKGIGVWTAEMFLIFALNRPDVLPVGDMGVRAGIENRHGLAELPKPKRMPRAGRALAALSQHRQLVSLEGRRYARDHDRGRRRGTNAVPAPQAGAFEHRSTRTRHDLRLDHQGGLGDRRLRRAAVSRRRRTAGIHDRRGGPARRGRGRARARRNRAVRRPRLHRRPRPRRPHAPGRPDPPPRIATGGDDLHHRPGRQLVRPGLAGHARLHAPLHRRLQRQPGRVWPTTGGRSTSTWPASTARPRSTWPI